MERKWFRLILAVILTIALGYNAYGEDEEYEYYKIKKGDNYTKIARIYQDLGYTDVTKESLKELNNIDETKLPEGRKIKIRKKQTSSSYSGSSEKKDNESIINTETNEKICGKTIEEKPSIVWYLLLIGVVCLAICILVRAKYWTKIKYKRKDIIWLGAVLVSLLLGALAWESVRTVVLWSLGIAVVVAIAVLVIRAVAIRKKAEPQGRVDVNPAKPKDDTDRNKQLIAQLNKDNERYREQIIQLKGEIENYRKRIAELENKNREIFNENISLGERLDAIGLTTKPPVNKESAEAEKVNKENKEIASSEDFAGTKLYAESIVDGYLFRVKDTPGDDSVFELQQKGSNYATFTIYSEAERRVVANPSYLDGCDKQLLGRSSVKIIRQGEAHLDDNGKWKVNTKLLVHIE